MSEEETWRGKTEEEVKEMSLEEFSELVTADERRKIKRGFTESEQKLLEKVRDGQDGIKTHCRNMIIVPSMLGKTLHVYDGQNFEPVEIDLEMLGHRLGEFALTRRKVDHSAPGIGATRSSSAISLK